MKSRTTNILLAIVAVLLAANLVSPLLYPAQAQAKAKPQAEAKFCTSVSSVWDARINGIHLYRAWSDGKVEEREITGNWSDLNMNLR